MKVIRTIDTFHPFVSGPVKQALEVSKRLERNGISSPVYTSTAGPEGLATEDEHDGVRIRRYGISLSFMRYYYTPDLKKDLLTEDFDIIHSHNYRNYQAQAGYAAARKRGKPFIISAHGSLLGYRRFLGRMQQIPYDVYDILTGAEAVRKADRVIVASKIEEEEALEFGIDKARIVTIPMGIDVGSYRTARKGDDRLTVLFVGRISRNRNLEPLIEAMKSIPEMTLRIVGDEAKSSAASKDGYLDELKTIASGAENIMFCGGKFGEDLIKEYKDADIFAYSSISENLGQTILEAAASGLPIISTPVGIAPEIVKDGETGYIVQAEPSLFADRLKRLRDGKLRSKMGERIQKTVEREFSWDSIMMRYEKMYLDVLEGRT
jgi:glycosyltransferase involved in cell wall biosynthesis